ncbi:KOW motif-containing protein [Chloroflexota bacterium]
MAEYRIGQRVDITEDKYAGQSGEIVRIIEASAGMTGKFETNCYLIRLDNGKLTDPVIREWYLRPSSKSQDMNE